MLLFQIGLGGGGSTSVAPTPITPPIGCSCPPRILHIRQPLRSIGAVVTFSSVTVSLALSTFTMRTGASGATPGPGSTLQPGKTGVGVDVGFGVGVGVEVGTGGEVGVGVGVEVGAGGEVEIGRAHV